MINMEHIYLELIQLMLFFKIYPVFYNDLTYIGNIDEDPIYHEDKFVRDLRLCSMYS
jgi:hypothetical protein